MIFVINVSGARPPVDICTEPSCLVNIFATVPLPAPGARIELVSLYIPSYVLVNNMCCETL